MWKVNFNAEMRKKKKTIYSTEHVSSPCYPLSTKDFRYDNNIKGSISTKIGKNTPKKWRRNVNMYIRIKMRAVNTKMKFLRADGEKYVLSTQH